MICRTALLICGLASISAAQSQTDWRFAHPNADMRMSINVQAILKSPAVANAIKQMSTQAKENAAQIQLVLGILGTIDRISISAHQKAAGDMDTLAMVTGTFEPAMAQAFFPSTGTSQVKQVGAHSILIGDGASFTEALTRMTNPARAGVHDDLEQNDIWIEGGPAILARPEAQQAPAAFRGLRALSMGFNLGESAELNLILTAANEPAATQMTAAVQQMLAQALTAPMGASAVERVLTVKQQGSKVRMHFLVPPELMQFAQTQATSGSFASQLQPLLGMMGISSAKPTPSSTAPAVTVPDTGGKIVIYGLDDGPREIKVK